MVDIKTKEDALEQLEKINTKALIRLAKLSTDKRIVDVFTCPAKHAILKAKINQFL